MPKDYDEIASEHTAPLVDDEQQSPESTQTNPNGESTSGNAESHEVYTFGETEYSQRDIEDALHSHKNMEAMRTSNTQKSQEISDQRKLMEPFLSKFAPELKSKPELAEALDDVWKDITGSEEGISGLLTPEGVDQIASPFQGELDTVTGERDALQEEIDILKADIALEKETLELKGAYKHVNDEMVEELAQGALDRFEKTGTWMSLEDVLKLDHPNWANPAQAHSTNNGSRGSSAPETRNIPKSYDAVPTEAYGNLVD
jgi:hypothetical protein